MIARFFKRTIARAIPCAAGSSRSRPARAVAEVTVESADGIEVVSIIFKESAELLRLVEGETVDAIIKAGDVMIATG